MLRSRIRLLLASQIRPLIKTKPATSCIGAVRHCGMFTVLNQTPLHSNLSAELLSELEHSKPTQVHNVDQALHTLHHRGPDSHQQWTNHSGVVTLGHTRLAVIDLTATGDQPMHDFKHGAHAVVNGELYDYQNIRNQARAEGWKLYSASDSETVLYLYHRYGPNFVRKLRGEFALSLWDEKTETLVVARDRTGAKPLYYTIYKHQLILASEMKAIFAYGVPAVWNSECIMSSGWTFGGVPIFKGVHQFPPGHYMIAQPNGELTLHRYWDFDFPDSKVDDNAALIPQNEQEMILGVRERLKDAVGTRLIADVPVGVYLSGGLDSCSVLGIASTASQKPLDAFSISFTDDERFDEAKIAENMAKHVDARFHLLRVNSNDLVNALEPSVYHYESLIPNLNGAAKYLLSQSVRECGIKVIMTGEGADEIFAGYSFFRQDVARYHLLDILAKKYSFYKAEQLQQEYEEKLQATCLLADKARTIVPINVEETEAICDRILGYTPTMIRDMPLFTPIPRHLFHRSVQSVFPDRHPLLHVTSSPFICQKMIGRIADGSVAQMNGSLYLESKTMLPNILLRYLGDNMEMAHSVEGRLPYLDHQLVDYVSRLPIDMKIRVRLIEDGERRHVRMTEKHVLKEAAKPFITEEVYKRTKHPFLAPPSLMNKQSRLYEFIQSTLRSDDMTRVSIIDKAAVIRLLDDIHQYDCSADRPSTGLTVIQSMLRMETILLHLVSLCILGKRFNVTENPMDLTDREIIAPVPLIPRPTNPIVRTT